MIDNSIFKKQGMAVTNKKSRPNRESTGLFPKQKWRCRVESQ